MKFLDSFRKLFSKKAKEEEKEKRVKQVQKVTGQNLNAKIQADIKKEKEQYRESTIQKLTIEDFDKENKEAKEKEMRELIEIKRRQTIKADEAKKKNKTLSSNF